ncbi:RpnC/YadD family protein [Spirosoma radiotolerans]|uniref:Uncharacterized protein n=1 Tax=Spirosoma radiotolerans TaxID=1379870 RepID=A0A0E3ZSK1_9BACT|nr:hypothetical protein [Spirosoma radiotolerans]AKD54160.1 hypothetical protein SD10_03790 [Spirosoma radiotolerans]
MQNSRRKRELTRLLDTFADVVQRLVETPSGQRFITTGFLYLSYTTNLTKIELFGIFSRISTKTNSSTMTVAEELIQEGRELERRQNKTVAEELIQEGRELERRQHKTIAEELIQQGRELERRQNEIKFITAMLKLNHDAAAIASATELPLDEVKAIIDEINRPNTP